MLQYCPVQTVTSTPYPDALISASLRDEQAPAWQVSQPVPGICKSTPFLHFSFHLRYLSKYSLFLSLSMSCSCSR
jgi:hypothetical protein